MEEALETLQSIDGSFINGENDNEFKNNESSFITENLGDESRLNTNTVNEDDLSFEPAFEHN